jgi:SGNH domain (fused to AT3 domains)
MQLRVPNCVTLALLAGCVLFGLLQPGASAASKNVLATYATQSQVTAAVGEAQHLRSAPSKVIPSIQVLARDGDFGIDLAHGCAAPSEGVSTEDVPACTFGDKASATTIVLTGDSRAQMWFDALDIVAKAEKVKLVLLAKAGCPAPLATYEEKNAAGITASIAWTACSDWHKFAIRTIDRLKPTVVLISAEQTLSLASPIHTATPAETQADMIAYLKTIPPTSKAVVLGGFPEPGPLSPTLCLSREPSAIHSCDFTPYSYVVANNAADRAAATAERAGFIDQTPWLCAATCPPIIDGIIPYTIDGYHLDTAYTEYLAGALWESLEPYVRQRG